MSKTLSSVARTEFDSMVQHSAQTAGVLRNTVTIRNGVVGDTYKFRNMGKGLAQERTAPSSDSIAMDINHNFATATLTNWDAPEYTDIFDQAEVNFDEVRELAYTITSALGRRLDQLCIDAMVAGTYSATPAAGEGGLVGTDVGGVGTSLNVAKLRRASRFLNDRGVSMSGRHIAVSAQGLEDLLGETEATSADYNTVRALVQGEIDTFVGFKFHIIESREEGGLPKPASVRDCFAWHMDGIGLAIGKDISTRVDWSVDKDSWKSTGYLKGGAVIRDNERVVKVQITEA